MEQSTSDYYKSNYAARKRRREQQRRYNKTKKGLALRVNANAINRAKGTYGNRDGLDVSHDEKHKNSKNPKHATLKKASVNRRSRLKTNRNR